MGEEDHLEEYGRRLDVHHITPAREIDDPDERNAMDNLITLCRGGCHHTWEQMAPLRPDTAEVAD
jgi:predicted HNH restriction endonuclease